VQGENKMRTFFLALFIALTVIIGIDMAAPKEAAACEHYYTYEYVGTVTYRIEYNCDGSMVGIEIIED
jgi:hypothetical protein